MPPYCIFVVMLFTGLGALVGMLLYECRDMAVVRTRQLSAVAARLGLGFRAERDKTLGARFPGFAALCDGDRQYAWNIMSGQVDGREVWAFDYFCEDQLSKRAESRDMSAVILESPVPLRDLLIRRERLIDKVPGLFEDINFESAEFNREFFVEAKDRKWASDVIHPRMMEFLLQTPGFEFQFVGRHVMLWGSIPFAPATFPRAIAAARGVLDRLPEYVMAQQRDCSDASPGERSEA